MRVLKWILKRVEGKAEAKETPIGYVPTQDSLTLDGLDISDAAMEELLAVNAADWSREADEIGAFLDEFGDSLPKEIRDEQAALAKRLGHVGAAV